MELFKTGRRTQGEARREKKKVQCRVLYLPDGKRAFFFERALYLPGIN
jgi:hypothetical protein